MQRLAEHTRSVAVARSYWRGVCASVLGAALREPAEQIVARNWRGDETARYHARAATSPASTGESGWAADLTGLVTTPLALFAPSAAISKLAANALNVTIPPGAHQAAIPLVVTPPTATWVSEGSPGAMVQPVLGSVIFGPLHKLLYGCAVTAELVDYGVETAVGIVQRTIVAASVTALDTALLDSTPGDTSRPSGLLVDVADLGATAGGGINALTTDLALLAGTISDAGIDTESLVFLMNPRQALVARGLLTGPAFDAYTILATSAVAAGTIVAIAPSALAMSVGLPEIETSSTGVVHLDTEPGDIGSPGGGVPSGGAVVSAWQTQLLLLKLRVRVEWQPLAAAAVQKIESCTW
jgi:hypothetical protein